MIDVKIEKTKVVRSSKTRDLEGFEISYRINNSKQWDSIILTTTETLTLLVELLTEVLKELIS